MFKNAKHSGYWLNFTQRNGYGFNVFIVKLRVINTERPNEAIVAQRGGMVVCYIPFRP